jgi:transcriptional regulator with XRE-family HTH domain
MGFDRKGFDREVGRRLQLVRKRREMTQEQLAREIGITRASYANVEAGRQRIPLDIVWRAAVVLGVSISSLVPEAINRGAAAANVPAPLATDVFSTSPHNLANVLRFKAPSSD